MRRELSPSQLFVLDSGACARFERAQKISRDAGYFINCSQQRSFVCFRRCVKTADFSHELERSSSNLFGGDRRIEIEEDSDIPGHHYDLKVQNAQGRELCSRVTILLSSILRWQTSRAAARTRSLMAPVSADASRILTGRVSIGPTLYGKICVRSHKGLCLPSPPAEKIAARAPCEPDLRSPRHAGNPSR
jgi:hypothetical protein